MGRKINRKELSKIKAKLREQNAVELEQQLQNQTITEDNPDNTPKTLNDIKKAIREEAKNSPDSQPAISKSAQIKNAKKKAREQMSSEPKTRGIKWNHKIGDLVLISHRNVSEQSYGIIVSEDVDESYNGTGSHAVHYDRTLFLVMSPSGNHWHYAKSLAVCK